MKKCFKFLITFFIILDLTTSVSYGIIETVNEDRIITQEDRLQKIKEKGVLTVLSANDEPYSYKDPRTGEFRGFDADIIREVAKRLGIKEVDARYISFNNAIDELIKNPNVDILGEGLYITDERKKILNFTNPIYTTSEVILTRKDSGINGKGDLKDAIVGVLGGTLYTSIVDNWKREGILKDYMAFYDDNSLIIALENGSVNAVLTDSIIAENIILVRPKSNFRILSPSQYKSEIDFNLGYPLKKEDITLLDAINEKLQEMKNDGTIYEILARYGLTGHYIP